MGRKTKAWIKGMRVVQLVLRVVELVAALGFLALMILINNVEPLTGWVVRIAVCSPSPPLLPSFLAQLVSISGPSTNFTHRH